MRNSQIVSKKNQKKLWNWIEEKIKINCFFAHFTILNVSENFKFLDTIRYCLTVWSLLKTIEETYLSCSSYIFGNFGSPGLMQSLITLSISPNFRGLRSQFPNSMKSDFGTFQNRRQVGIGQRAGWADTSSTAWATANAAGTGLILAEKIITYFLRICILNQ